MELFPPGKGCLNPPFIVSKQLYRGKIYFHYKPHAPNCF